MPGETTRKVIRFGPGAGVICLPADYRRYHKLEPGTTVRVLYDSILIVIPPGVEERLQKKIDLLRELLEG